jgi:hypothetical protein
MWRGKGWVGGGGLLGSGIWCFVVEMGVEKCCAMWDRVRWMRYLKFWRCVCFYTVVAESRSLGIRACLVRIAIPGVR